MDKESLEAPLSLEELYVSLKSLQKGKSPGLDGLPQCWAVTSYCNLVTVIILLFAVTSSVTNY